MRSNDVLFRCHLDLVYVILFYTFIFVCIGKMDLLTQRRQRLLMPQVFDEIIRKPQSKFFPSYTVGELARKFIPRLPPLAKAFDFRCHNVFIEQWRKDPSILSSNLKGKIQKKTTPINSLLAVEPHNDEESNNSTINLHQIHNNLQKIGASLKHVEQNIENKELEWELDCRLRNDHITRKEILIDLDNVKQRVHDLTSSVGYHGTDSGLESETEDSWSDDKSKQGISDISATSIRSGTLDSRTSNTDSKLLNNIFLACSSPRSDVEGRVSPSEKSCDSGIFHENERREEQDCLSEDDQENAWQKTFGEAYTNLLKQSSLNSEFKRKTDENLPVIKTNSKTNNDIFCSVDLLREKYQIRSTQYPERNRSSNTPICETTDITKKEPKIRRQNLYEKYSQNDTNNNFQSYGHKPQHASVIGTFGDRCFRESAQTTLSLGNSPSLYDRLFFTDASIARWRRRISQSLWAGWKTWRTNPAFEQKLEERIEGIYLLFLAQEKVICKMFANVDNSHDQNNEISLQYLQLCR